MAQNNTFTNKYTGGSNKPAFVEMQMVNGVPTATNAKVVDEYYELYKKFIDQPMIVEVELTMDIFESSNVDFRKPIYVKEWGKYCLLLELIAPNKGVCTAKLLLINQTL